LFKYIPVSTQKHRLGYLTGYRCFYKSTYKYTNTVTK